MEQSSFESNENIIFLFTEIKKKVVSEATKFDSNSELGYNLILCGLFLEFGIYYFGLLSTVTAVCCVCADCESVHVHFDT